MTLTKRPQSVFIACFVLLPLLLMFTQTLSVRAESDDERKVKVLLVTGIEYHNWRETAPQIAKQLNSCPNLDVSIDTNFNVLCMDEIFDYDVLYFNFVNLRDYNVNTLDDELAIGNIEKFLKMGKGIIIHHLAIGIFEQYHADRILTILGRNYDRALPPHDPFREFEVRIVDKKHPITRHLSDFMILDELYTCAGGDLPIEVLAESTSVNDKKSYPMAYLYKYGDGHVFTSLLGHDNQAFASQQYVTMLRNAALWLGKQDVPSEPAEVVSPAKPIIDGRFYPVVKEEIEERISQVENQLQDGQKLLVYLNCGREWDKSASSGELISVHGDAYFFPGSRDVWESDSPCLGYIVSGNPITVNLSGLNPEKTYRLALSWWDFDGGGRVQSAKLVSRDGKQTSLVVKEKKLPSYYPGEQAPETVEFTIDPKLVKDGACDCVIDCVKGPNAVLSEVWLIEN